MTKAAIDRVYYWIGGTERGRWQEIVCQPSEVSAKLAEVERMGYRAVRGSSAIGAPEGPPNFSALQVFPKAVRR